MKVAIHQPQYLPWLGYIEKIDACDLFVVLDNVQFEKNDWQNRNKVYSPDSPESWRWLTVPVRHKFPQLIKDVTPDDNRPWRRKHVKTLETVYHRAPHFDNYYPVLHEILTMPSASLVDLNVALLRFLFACLGIEKHIVLSSTLDVTSHPSRRLAEICDAVGADEFLVGRGSLNYLESSPFDDANVTLRLQDYRHPRYTQFGGDFVSHLSTVDLLFHHGPASLHVIRQGSHWTNFPLSAQERSG